MVDLGALLTTIWQLPQTIGLKHVSAQLIKTGEIMLRSKDAGVIALREFLVEVLRRDPHELAYFMVTYQPGLTHFRLVFRGANPAECLYGYLWQRDDGSYRVYQWNRHWRDAAYV